MAPADTIGVGLAGYGLAGRTFHAPFVEAVDGLRLAAIVTADPERRVLAAEEHPDTDVVGSVDELLDRSDVDMVVVATPNRFHVPIGLRALAAGRHVVVDKPIAMSVSEGETLIDAAAAAGRLLSVYQNRRWDGDFRTIRRLIADGALGPIDSLESRFERSSQVGPEWRESAIEAGGPLRDLGPHLVDQSLILFGPARRVWAQADRRRRVSEVDDSVFVAIDHESGVRSRLWTSLIASCVGPRFRLRGLAAEYVKDDLDAQEGQLLGGMGPHAPGFGEEVPEKWGRLHRADGSIERVPTEPGRYEAFYELLRDAVRTDGPPPVDPIESLRVLRVLEAAERAATSGTAQTVADASVARLPIGLGLVGCGRMGVIHARAIAGRVPEARLVAIADVNVGAARRLAGELAIDVVLGSAVEVAERPDVAAVVIAVPSGLHLEVVRQVAAAGRDMLCEKPLALTVADTQAAIAATDRAGVRLQVGLMRRFDAAYRRGFRRLERGEIGRPIIFKSLQFDPGPPPPDQADPAVSGGIHVDMGVHEYDLARWLMGDEVVEVHAWGSSLAHPDLAAVGDVDSATVNLRFAGGAIGSIELARSSLYEDVRTEIVGQRGTIAIGSRPAAIVGQAGSGDALAPATPGWGSGPLRFERAYAAQIRSFVRAIAADAPVEVGGAESLAALRIALAARRSMSEGRPIAVGDA